MKNGGFDFESLNERNRAGIKALEWLIPPRGSFLFEVKLISIAPDNFSSFQLVIVAPIFLPLLPGIII
jgi:hypothetical protein